MRILLRLACLSLFTQISFSQEQARKLDEFGYVQCGDLLSRVDAYSERLFNDSEGKLYFVYYEGLKYEDSYWNKKTKRYESQYLNPRRGDALNRTKAITLYLTKYRKFSSNKLVLIDGGYAEEYKVEVWFVPKESVLPKPTPTRTEKDVNFRKGEPFCVRDCQAYYDRI